jgi:hypothetical protein
VLHTVITMIQSAFPVDCPADEIAARLSTGNMDAYWVLTPDNQHAGVIAVQIANDEKLEARVMYFAAVAVAPHVAEAGWLHLSKLFRGKAMEQGCHFLQFDTTPDNERVTQIASMIGAKRAETFEAFGMKMHRYLAEV